MHDLFAPYEILHLNEVLDTKIPVDRWWKEGETLVGELSIDDVVYHIFLEPGKYEFQDKTYAFISTAFTEVVDGIRIQEAKFNKGNPANALKIIGAIVYEFYDTLRDYENDVITFAANSIEQRMRIYSTVSRWEGRRLGASLFPNVKFPKGTRAIVVFSSVFDEKAIKNFVQYISNPH